MKVYSQQSFPRPSHLEPVSQAMAKWHPVKYVWGPDILTLTVNL